MEKVCGDRFTQPKIQITLIFGLGLIGKSLVVELERHGFSEVASLIFSWKQSSSIQTEEISGILKWVKSRVSLYDSQGYSSRNVSVAVIWTAGSGGFSSKWEVLDKELVAFNKVAVLSQWLLESLPFSFHSFHMASSAGGLFEGQLNVHSDSAPAPVRPYGELKLQQELQLAALPEATCKFVYRPSSVYGFVSMRSRLGLVATLITNALQGRVTTIFADVLTLRDYVSVRDVAQYIACKVVTVAPPRTYVYTLASGKSTSIWEALMLLRRHLDRQFYCVFRPAHDNSASTTFSSEVLPNDFKLNSLEMGLVSTILSIRGQLI